MNITIADINKNTNFKPCPFCGDANIQIGIGLFSGAYGFSCKNCHAEIEFPWKDANECIEAWNRRSL